MRVFIRPAFVVVCLSVTGPAAAQLPPPEMYLDVPLSVSLPSENVRSAAISGMAAATGGVFQATDIWNGLGVYARGGGGGVSTSCSAPECAAVYAQVYNGPGPQTWVPPPTTGTALYAHGGQYGVYATTAAYSTPQAPVFAGWFEGNVTVTGTLVAPVIAQQQRLIERLTARVAALERRNR